MALEMRGQGDGAHAGEGPDREDVPGVGGQHVDGVVVDFFWGVGAPAMGLELTQVTGSQPHLGGFDLHAKEAATLFDSDVVAW